VKKCGGVPLAIKALGNLMRLKESEDEWIKVKKSEIWDLREEASEILPALRLSYTNLSPHLKQCFAFCAIFPKDHQMRREELIALWMANGFISCRNEIDLHIMGLGIFNELVGRTFLQEVHDDGFGNVTCKMHDLMHDLAQSIAVQECCMRTVLCILDRKQTQIKHNTSRFTWFPKTGYVHGGSRLYIIGGMIQTFNSTQYNPTKPSVSLLHSVFLSNLHFLTLSQLHLHSLHTFSTLTHSAISPFCTLSRLSLYRRMEKH
jgi:hypothetical protein